MRHGPGHGTWNVDRHTGELAASGSGGVCGERGLGEQGVWSGVAWGDHMPGFESRSSPPWAGDQQLTRPTPRACGSSSPTQDNSTHLTGVLSEVM